METGMRPASMSDSASSKRDVDASLNKVRLKCLANGFSGIKTLSVAFRQFDRDFSKQISLSEFETGLQLYDIDVDKKQLHDLFNQFDRDGSGNIDFSEFYHRLSPPLTGKRLQVVKEVFKDLDKNRNGVLEYEDIREQFGDKVTQHPKYQSGDWSERDVIQNLLRAIEPPESRDGAVTFEEFHDYYATVSTCVQDDSYFESRLKASWCMK